MDISPDISSEKCFADTIYVLGPIVPGEIASKKIKIKNTFKDSQDYEVHRDESASFVSKVFHIDVERFTVALGDSVVLTVSYAPGIPFSAEFEAFAVSGARNFHLEFGVLGRSTGPEVQLLSSNNIIFLSEEKKKVFRKLALKNVSAVTAYYQFDLDWEQPMFAVDKLAGEILPHQQEHVTVEFAPPCEGIFSKRLTCMILHQCPIMVDAIGVCILSKSGSLRNLHYERYVESDVQMDSCGQFVGDQCFITRHLPPLRLSQDYLAFELEDDARMFSVTNIMQEEIVLEWNKDASGVFSIEPERTSIMSQHTALFEARFNPTSPFRLYGAQLDGMARWGDTRHSFGCTLAEKHIHVPVHVTVSMIGHSFSAGARVWAPQCEVHPTTVVMPPCLPPGPVYSSMLITRAGHLPLMFRFIPPADSMFAVRPLQGLVRGKFQIVVVRLCPELHGEAVYQEDWRLQLNGCPQHERTIQLRGCSAYPRVVVGDGNVVSLPITYPGCEQAFCVPVKNISKHCVRYKYELLSDDDLLQFDNMEGTLAVNETCWHTWTFSPRVLGSCEFQVRFEVHALRCAGAPTVLTVSCYGESHYSELVADPNSVTFDILLWGETKSWTFGLSNPGSSPVCYQLSCRPTTLLSTPDNDVELRPRRDELLSGDTQQVTLLLTPTDEGLHGFVIVYDVCRNLNSDEIIPDSRRSLVDVRYNCIVPKMGIVDLNVNGQGPHLGRISFWRTMEINKWNEALQRLRPGQAATVAFGLPQFPVGERIVDVFLLLRAQSQFPVQWSVRRHQQCSCRPEERAHGLSHRVWENICPHRGLLTFTPTSGSLQGGEEQVLRLKVSYWMEGRFQLSHSLLLSCGRELRLDTELVAHGPHQLSLAPDNLHLGVFIADPDPVAQCIWLYNHTEHALDYEVDVSQLQELNQQHFGCTVVACLNPCGTVQSSSAGLLLFKVKPLRLQTLEISATLKVGEEQLALKLSSEGMVDFRHHLPYMRSRMPEVCSVPLEEIPIVTSLDHLVVGPVTTHSTVQRIFFLSNVATTTVFGYHWRSCGGGDGGAQQGVLQPGDKQVCQLMLTTLGTPVLATFSLSCELLDLAQRRLHSRSVGLQRALAAKHKGQFTITKDGVSYPEIQVDVGHPPPVLQKVMSISMYICSLRGSDLKIPVQQQLRLALPRAATALTGIRLPLHLSVEEFGVITRCLEMILWEILHSSLLRWQLRELAREDGHTSYCRFVMDDEEEARLVAESQTSPSHWLLTRTLGDILYDILLDHVGLHHPNESLSQLRRISTLFADSRNN